MAARHEQWMGKYGRVYTDAAEKARRLEVFKANVALIESANAGNSKFWLEANQFADITEDEFRATHSPTPSKLQKTTTIEDPNSENRQHSVFFPKNHQHWGDSFQKTLI